MGGRSIGRRGNFCGNRKGMWTVIIDEHLLELTWIFREPSWIQAAGCQGNKKSIPKEAGNRRNLGCGECGKVSKIGTQGQDYSGKYPDLGIRCPESWVICSLTCLPLDKYSISLSISILICEMRIMVFAYVIGFLWCSSQRRWQIGSTL